MMFNISFGDLESPLDALLNPTTEVGAEESELPPPAEPITFTREMEDAYSSLVIKAWGVGVDPDLVTRERFAAYVNAGHSLRAIKPLWFADRHED